MTELPWKSRDIRFSGVASAHETVERDEQGRARFLGYVLQFGEWTLYHSGDTVRYTGMAEKLRPLRSSGRAATHQWPCT